MTTVYITKHGDGIWIHHLIPTAPEDRRRALAKTLFESGRTTDKETHFHPDVHTLALLAKGFEGHDPIEVLAEIDEAEIPEDRYFRNAWEFSNADPD